MSDDVTKLPKWAQQKIDTLEKNIEYWKTHVAGDITESDTGVYRYGDTSTRLHPGEQVRFVATGGDIETSGRQGYVDVRVRDGWVELYAAEPLVLRSHSSNVMYVRPDRS